MMRRSLLAVLLVSVLVACTATPDPEDTTPPRITTDPASPGMQDTDGAGEVETPEGDPVVESVVVTGLRSPWGLAFLPDGSALVSERDTARIVHIVDGRTRVVGEVPGVAHGGEGGLLGIAVSPEDDADDVEVFAYLTSSRDNRVVAMGWDGTRLGAPRVILEGIPRAQNHNGGRMRFGPDGFLYVATGDANNERLSQDPDSLGGKILRITRDGLPAPDNPTTGSPVYSFGHRNVQGLAFTPEGILIATEFGQRRWDELNRIEPDGNYGWPRVEGRGGGDRFIDPLAQWRPADASPSGLAMLGRSAFMASLRGQRLWRIDLDADARLDGEPRDYFVGEHGRLRTVEVAPDGSLWLITNNTDGRGDPRQDDDRILRISFE
jgi:aldose sugar dehydrogenase